MGNPAAILDNPPNRSLVRRNVITSSGLYTLGCDKSPINWFSVETVGYQGSPTQSAKGALFGQLRNVPSSDPKPSVSRTEFAQRTLVLVEVRTDRSDANARFQELLLKDMPACL